MVRKRRYKARTSTSRATNPGDRNYKFPEYAKFRRLVRIRDGYKCQMCGDNKKLKIHHIRRWADAPGLRFAISNGVTLCRSCHDKISGNEDSYRPMFSRIALRNAHNLINSPLSDSKAISREAKGDVPNGRDTSGGD